MDKGAHRLLAVFAGVLALALVLDRAILQPPSLGERVLARDLVGQLSELEFHYPSGVIRAQRGPGGEFARVRAPAPSRPGRLREDTLHRFLGALEVARPARVKDASWADQQGHVVLRWPQGRAKKLARSSVPAPPRMAWMAVDDQLYLIERHLARELAPTLDQLLVRRPFVAAQGVFAAEFSLSHPGTQRHLVVDLSLAQPSFALGATRAFLRRSLATKIVDALRSIELAPVRQMVEQEPTLVIRTSTHSPLSMTVIGACAQGALVESSLGRGCVAQKTIALLDELLNAPASTLLAPPLEGLENRENATLRIVRGEQELVLNWRSGRVFLGDKEISRGSVASWWSTMGEPVGEPAELARGTEIARIEFVAGALTRNLVVEAQRGPHPWWMRRDFEAFAFPITQASAELIRPDPALFARKILVDLDPYQWSKVVVKSGEESLVFTEGEVIGEWFVNGHPAPPAFAELVQTLQYLEGEKPAHALLAERQRTITLFSRSALPSQTLRLGFAKGGRVCTAQSSRSPGVWSLSRVDCSRLSAPLAP